MEYFNLAIAYAMEFLATILFANRLMDKRMKTPLIVVFGAIPVAVSYALYFAFESLILNNISTTLMFFFILIIGYKDTIGKKIVYSIYLIIAINLSEFLWFIPIYKSTDVIVNITNNDKNQLLVILISKISFFILSQLLVLLVRYKDFKQNNKYLPLFIYPFAANTFLVSFLYLCTKVDISDGFYWSVIVMFIIIAITSITLFPYYQSMDDKDRKLKELEKEQQFVELNNSYMQVLEHQNNELQMVFHDTKHHFMAIENMDDANEMKAYIHKIIPAMESNNNVNISSNKMLNLLLNKYIVICKSKGIRFTYDVKTVSLDYIDDSELSILICNILDNAIESAEQSKDKTISMSIKHINSMDLLSVENSCDIEPRHKGGKLITSKADAHNHGYGTKIIEKHSKMNNGQMEWSYDKDEHIFCLSILFQR